MRPIYHKKKRRNAIEELLSACPLAANRQNKIWWMAEGTFLNYCKLLGLDPKNVEHVIEDKIVKIGLPKQ